MTQTILMDKINLLFVVLALSVSSCAFFDRDKDNTASSLLLDYSIISIEIGESTEVTVKAVKEGGAADSFTVEASNSYVSVVSDAEKITVSAAALGETDISVSSASGLSTNLKVRVIDPVALMTDGLLIRWTDQFTPTWNDSGSGGDHDGAYYMPIAAEGYYPLGSYGQGNYSNPNSLSAAIIVKALNDSTALAAPIDYTHIWSDSGSGADADGSFWLPVAPEGYVACGIVAQSGYGKPSLEAIRCVRSDLTANAKIGNFVWNDSGTGAHSDFGSWEVAAPDAPASTGKAYLKAGTFIGVASHSAPASHAALNILHLHLPLAVEVPNSNYVPRLLNRNEPETFTKAYLAKIVEIPFNLITDGAYSLHDKVSQFPIYRFQRQELFEKKYFYYNIDGSTDIIHTVETKKGISQTDSESYSHSVGVSITAEGGCKLIGGSVSVSVSYQFGYENTSSLTVFEEQSLSQQVVIPPGKTACLWQKTNLFSILRKNNNWETVAGSEKYILMNSFVKGEY